ncbi:hypothetical protein [Nonomuraea lactucae]|uniref:hypothetical protein n=1 Tax=Nonomuraea lactucae TaxID=2249762 RepID=UPI000DE49710|nr:hypothetical protein [Nonomuraea lactucae]
MKLYGPANPFAILDIARSQHAGGVSRADITYPDGVMVEIRYRLPVEPAYLLANADLMPINSRMINTATEEEADGTYCYFTFWCPARGRDDPLACPDTPAGVGSEFDLYKTVAVG